MFSVFSFNYFCRNWHFLKDTLMQLLGPEIFNFIPCSFKQRLEILKEHNKIILDSVIHGNIYLVPLPYYQIFDTIPLVCNRQGWETGNISVKNSVKYDNYTSVSLDMVEKIWMSVHVFHTFLEIMTKEKCNKTILHS